jgi:hypothetical protein
MLGFKKFYKLQAGPVPAATKAAPARERAQLGLWR